MHVCCVFENVTSCCNILRIFVLKLLFHISSVRFEPGGYTLGVCCENLSKKLCEAGERYAFFEEYLILFNCVEGLIKLLNMIGSSYGPTQQVNCHFVAYSFRYCMQTKRKISRKKSIDNLFKITSLAKNFLAQIFPHFQQLLHDFERTD